jgi:hypothetical protein
MVLNEAEAGPSAVSAGPGEGAQAAQRKPLLLGSEANS